MSGRDFQNRIDYYVVCVNDFSEAHSMPYSAGFDYLKTYGGLDFLDKFYDVEHSYPIEEAVADLAQVCRRNGGRAA